jgi:hypothetical protein
MACRSWRATTRRFPPRRRVPRLGGEPVLEPGPILAQPGLAQGVSPRLARRGLRTPAKRVESRRALRCLVRDPQSTSMTARIRRSGPRAMSTPAGHAPRPPLCRRGGPGSGGSRDGRPGPRRCCKPPRGPWCGRRCGAHRRTAARLTPSWRAMAARERWPACNNRPASKRRSSSCERVSFRGLHRMATQCKPTYMNLNRQ